MVAAVVCATPPERLERLDDRPKFGRRMLDGLVHGLLPFDDPRGHMVHFLEGIGQRSLQRRWLESNVTLDLLQVLLGPRL